MPKETLSPAECRDMMLAVADAIIAAEPVLTDADRALGDGDHGIGMSRGMNAVKDKLAGQEFESVEKVFTTMGMAMMSSMGGASGAVFGTLFRAGGKALTGAESFGSRELAAFFTAASEGVQTRGGAKVGNSMRAEDGRNYVAGGAVGALLAGLAVVLINTLFQVGRAGG